MSKIKNIFTGNRRQKKHAAASLLLNDLIDRTLPGGKLPGIRELMCLSGCGRPVIEAELRNCIEEKKISVRPRQGFFRNEARFNSRKIILLHDTVYFPQCGGGFVNILFDTLRTFIEAEGYEFDIINSSGEKIEFFQHAAEIFGTDKIMLLGCESKELAETAHKTFRFCMDLLPRHSAVLGAEIRDSPEMTLIQLNYLFRLNYRKIGYLHHVETDISSTLLGYQRLFDYYRIMAEHGLKVNPAWVLFAPWEWSEFEHAMDQFFASGDLPDAVIVPPLNYFYRYCKEHGIQIGKDIGVMGCDDYSLKLHPAVTTTTNDPKVIAEEAWQVMKELLKGNILHRTTTLHVRPGASICPRPIPQAHSF